MRFSTVSRTGNRRRNTSSDKSMKRGTAGPSALTACAPPTDSMIQTLQIQPKHHIIPIDDWETYLLDGEKFMRTAAGAFTKRKKAFSGETIYNITAMAVEKFIMAFLMKNGDLAENHTMADLAFALQRHLVAMPGDLAEKLRFLDSFQDICDMDSMHRSEPTPEELRKIIEIGLEIQELLTPHLKQ